jgi:hypothetical protein
MHAPRRIEDLREGGMALSERARQAMTDARTDPEAAHRVAGWYRGGEKGLLQSPESAFRLELRAAEGGHLEAQRCVAWAYYVGVGVKVDHAAAATWFGEAAERGDRDAQFNLGVAFRQGEGTPQNYELAAEWFQRAVDQGHSDAMVSLAALYNDGHGVEQDHAYANALYRGAVEAENNNTPASFNLGLSYFFEGCGVDKVMASALSFWQRAADQGHSDAQYVIGCTYVNGASGYSYSKNIQLARKYIKASAAQGDVEAVAALKDWNACAHCGAAAVSA